MPPSRQPHVTTRISTIVLTAAVMLMGACSPATPLPTSASHVTVPPQAAPDPAPAPAPVDTGPTGPVPTTMSGDTDVTLVVSNLKFVTSASVGGPEWYIPSFTLTETGGRSTARFTMMSLDYGSRDVQVYGDTPDGRGCLLWPEDKRVNAGGTWNSSSIYLYCVDPDTWNNLDGHSISISIEFRDDAGRRGRASVMAAVTR